MTCMTKPLTNYCYTELSSEIPGNAVGVVTREAEPCWQVLEVRGVNNTQFLCTYAFILVPNIDKIFFFFFLFLSIFFFYFPRPSANDSGNLDLLQF